MVSALCAQNVERLLAAEQHRGTGRHPAILQLRKLEILASIVNSTKLPNRESDTSVSDDKKFSVLIMSAHHNRKTYGRRKAQIHCKVASYIPTKTIEPDLYQDNKKDLYQNNKKDSDQNNKKEDEDKACNNHNSPDELGVWVDAAQLQKAIIESIPMASWKAEVYAPSFGLRRRMTGCLINVDDKNLYKLGDDDEEPFNMQTGIRAMLMMDRCNEDELELNAAHIHGIPSSYHS
ncbi:hypothetical protein FB45DRAFT_864964 [Roridomyces roridus]|uniref:Uncharacterized protein n=1 Tax=Roridomyces roridus TaxID=1738132 RepID=A0AAD7FSR7_9AGAR|nr:hypothetical protein FB45DRAFT_864964 [Roridomyces roridus]